LKLFEANLPLIRNFTNIEIRTSTLASLLWRRAPAPYISEFSNSEIIKYLWIKNF